MWTCYTTHATDRSDLYSFYQDIIAKGDYTKVLLVTEPEEGLKGRRRNPTIDALVRHHVSAPSAPRVEVVVQMGTLARDVDTLLHATHLVTAYGTFAWMLSLMSINIEKVFTVEPNVVPINQSAPRGYSTVSYTLPHYQRYWSSYEDRVAIMLNASSCRGMITSTVT